jgi:hypothetical protein
MESRYELFLAIGFTCTQSVAYNERFIFGFAHNRVLYVLFNRCVICLHPTARTAIIETNKHKN